MNIKLTGVIVTLGMGALLAGCTGGDSNPDAWSGYKTATPETRAMQDDDFSNPAMPWVDLASENWTKVEGDAGKSCASCHGDVKSMKGVGARYPVYDKETKKPINIELRINKCRTEKMKAKPYKYESDELLGMTALIRMQSRGMPVVSTAANEGDPLHQAWLKGKEFYYKRRGQLDMACSNCHEDHAGQYIRAELLSQGQSNGFPTYRLKWQKIGSLERRFRGCNKNIRAQPYGYGSDEYLNLETYLAWRGRGLKVETPSVRK